MNVDNHGESDYHAKVRAAAAALQDHEGPFVIAAHVDPDGDALGSSLALARALRRLGKAVTLPIEAPAFLAFLVEEGETSAPLEALPDDTLLVLLDTAERSRVEGAPTAGAAKIVELDHHGTNARGGDVSIVQPDKAATAQIVKDVIEALGLGWDAELATPCLTGLLTDTGIFRYGNTDADVLADAGDLIGAGVDYANLVDRLQWRPPAYFRALGEVMSTVAFPLGGLVSIARMTESMRARLVAEGAEEGDSSDFVGQIRYAEGTQLAIFLKERDGATKISVRSRGEVSAQAVCLELGGGGHVAAAGAKLDGDSDAVATTVLAAARRELERRGFRVPAQDAGPVFGAPAV